MSDVKIAKDKKWPVLALNIDDYGMTSPKPYDGLDPSGISTTAATGAVKAYAIHNTITVEGIANDETVALYTANGMLSDKTTSHNGTAKLNAQGVGVYLVKWANNTVKVIVTTK